MYSLECGFKKENNITSSPTQGAKWSMNSKEYLNILMQPSKWQIWSINEAIVHPGTMLR